MELNNELRELEEKMAESDKPENAARRTPAQLEERYQWSARAIAIRRKLQEIRENEYRAVMFSHAAGNDEY